MFPAENELPLFAALRMEVVSDLVVDTSFRNVLLQYREREGGREEMYFRSIHIEVMR